MTRAHTLPIAAALIALALLTAAAPSPDTATMPDAAYGEGGTRESHTNAKHELLGEIWRDEIGIIREQFEQDPDGTQYWGFYNGDGQNMSDWRRSVIAIRPMARPADRWQMWVIGPGDMTVKEASTLTRAELDTEFDYWHTQLRSWVHNAQRQQRSNR